jgi:hypothetical protein
VDSPWRTLVLVCSKCKGARRGPDARAIRKTLKKELGKRDALRVLEVGCLEVCPDGAVATCVIDAQPPNVCMQLVRSHEEVETLAANLRARIGGS